MKNLNLFQTHLKKNQGFTLIELLVVITIIGILATLSAVFLKDVPKKARDARRLSDLYEMRNALELYYTDNNNYPPGGYLSGAYDSTSIGDWSVTFKNAMASYMEKIPLNPTRDNTDSYFYGYWNPVTAPANPCFDHVALFIYPGLEAGENRDDCELGAYSVLIK